MKTKLQILLGLSLGILSMWWATKNTDWNQVWLFLQDVRPLDMAIVAVLFMIQQFLRAHRQILLPPSISYKNSLLVLCIGFFFINTLPARLGELTRPILLKEIEGLPISSGLAMVFTERLLDLMSAFVLALLFLSFADIPQLDDMWATRIAQGAQLILPLAMCTLIIFIGYGHRLSRFLPQRFANTLLPFFDTLKKQRTQLPIIICSTVIIWGMTPFLFLFGASSFGISLNYIDGIGVLGFTMIGMAAPNAPGFAGTYEASFMAGLHVLGLKQESLNFAFAFGFHWWVYFTQSLSALYFLATEKISFSQMLRQMRVSSKA
ncbi:MAG: hypothetical protein CL916_04470 [Deltaproteobacteria bacterium]|nr:hypothetical protein [Deltaproteobacteria bacterium]